MATGRVRVGWSKNPPATAPVKCDQTRSRSHPRVESRTHTHRVSGGFRVPVGFSITYQYSMFSKNIIGSQKKKVHKLQIYKAPHENTSAHKYITRQYGTKYRPTVIIHRTIQLHLAHQQIHLYIAQQQIHLYTLAVQHMSPGAQDNTAYGHTSSTPIRPYFKAQAHPYGHTSSTGAQQQQHSIIHSSSR
jgi:hypothetical protein